MVEPRAQRCKRLLHQSLYRGVLESDIVIGGFARARLDGLDDGQLDRYEALLAEPDQDLWAWVSGQRRAPARHDNDVLAEIIRYCRSRRDPS